MSDERCIHDMLPGQCGQRPCKDTPQGLTARVFITEGGDVFHRFASCEALRDGQRKARGRGQEIHEPRAMEVLDALATDRGACIRCFPDYAPGKTKLCWVRVDGRWVKGLLTNWKEKQPDKQWQGWTSYLAQTGQVTELKDAEDLRPRKPGESYPASSHL